MIWIHRLVTDRGFIEAFWTRLKEKREKDPSVSQEAVLEELYEEYRVVFGEDRFPSFDAFRKCRERYYSKQVP